jgi:hypothetical protein
LLRHVVASLEPGLRCGRRRPGFNALAELADRTQPRPGTERVEAQIGASLPIETRIYVVRGRQVMLDEELADLYGVETKRLVEQVKRNSERFPEDFMFQLDKPRPRF